jgi:uncharacterized protein YjbI with pentapeptide repeats
MTAAPGLSGGLFVWRQKMTKQIKTDANSPYDGSLDLRGCDLKGIKLPTSMGGSLDLSGCDLKGIKLPTSVGGSLDLSGCDLKGIKLPTSVGGFLDLGGCDLKGIKLPTSVGGSLDLSGEQWASLAFDLIQRFAAPWFADTLVVDDIHSATGWCKGGIRKAMGALGLECGDDVTEYSSSKVHAALRRAAGAVHDYERTSIALVILDRVEAGK